MDNLWKASVISETGSHCTALAGLKLMMQTRLALYFVDVLKEDVRIS